MQRLLPVLVGVGQLGLAAAWLFNGIAYLMAPPAMANAIKLAVGVRDGLGAGMLALGALVAAGAIARGSLAQTGLWVAAAAGVAWMLYAVVRHWSMFAIFFIFLTVVAVGLGMARSRLR